MADCLITKGVSYSSKDPEKLKVDIITNLDIFKLMTKRVPGNEINGYANLV